MRMMDVVMSEDLAKAWCKKMAPPLVTLLGAEPEVSGTLLVSWGAGVLVVVSYDSQGCWPPGLSLTRHGFIWLRRCVRLSLCFSPKAFVVNAACVSHDTPSPPPTQIQYIALRNINLIVQKRSSILANEVKASAVLSLGVSHFIAAHIDEGLETTRKRVQTMEVGLASAISAFCILVLCRTRNCSIIA